MTYDKLDKIGWKAEGSWNNRFFFSLTAGSRFSIFEHNGSYGIVDPYKDTMHLIYCNLKDDEIVKYAGLVGRYENMMNDPKHFTLYEYQEQKRLIKEFIEKMSHKEDDMEF